MHTWHIIFTTTLHAVFREGHQAKTIPIWFLIEEAHTSYNVLLGRPSLNTLGAIVSTPHLAMKFSSASGDIITIHNDQQLAHEYYIASLRPKEPTLTANNIERQSGASITLTRKDLDRRRGCDSRIELVEETNALEMSLGKALKLGVEMSSNDQALV